MNNSQNLASLRPSISTRLSSRGMFQSPTKIQNLGIVKISEATPKPAHSIDLDGCGPLENWEKNFVTPPQERHSRTSDQRFTQGNQRGGMPNQGRGRDRGPYTLKPLYCMYHGTETDHRIKHCPIFLESKTKMDQDSIEPSQQTAPQEVNHTMQWAPHYQ
jgi:hypothetical protein